MEYEIQWPPEAFPPVVATLSTGTMAQYSVSVFPRPGEDAREVGATISCHRGHRSTHTMSRRFKDSFDKWSAWAESAASMTDKIKAAYARSRGMAGEDTKGGECAICATGYRLCMQRIYDHDRLMLNAEGDGLRVFSAAGRHPIMAGGRRGRNWTFMRTMDIRLAQLLLDDRDMRLRVTFYSAVATIKGIWESPDSFASGAALLNLALDTEGMDATERARQFVANFATLNPPPAPLPVKTGGALANYLKRRGVK